MTPADLAAQAVNLLDRARSAQLQLDDAGAMRLLGAAQVNALLAIAGEMGCPLPDSTPGGDSNGAPQQASQAG